MDMVARNFVLQLIILPLAGLVLGIPAAAQEGFTHRGGNLISVSLATDGSESAVRVIGETGLGGVGSMAIGPDGMVYVLEVVTAAPERLHRINPATAESELVGDLDPVINSAFSTDMAFDDTGQLWLLGADALWQVDFETAASTMVVTDLEDFSGLGFHEGLFTSMRGVEGADEWELVILDPQTGEVTPIGIIGGIEGSQPPLFEFPRGMSFDAEGGLWINITQFTGGIDPPDIATIYLYLEDPLALPPGFRSFPLFPGWYPALAVRGPFPDLVEIPTLSLPGIATLALGLGLVAVGLLRRRSGSFLAG